MSKCPKCDKVISRVNLNDVSIEKWRGVSYCCPFCFSVLSIAIDPVALKADTVGGVAAELKPVHAHLAALQNQVAQIAQYLARK